MKTSYKINHDSMWVKVTEKKEWAKLTINRGGVKANFKGNMKWAAEILISEYRIARGEKLNNGEIIEKLASLEY